MNKPDFGATPTLASAFEHFLDQALFARRTRESYTDDLAPLLTRYGQAPVSALTPEIIQEYLTRQELLAPTTYNRRLAALRSFLKFLQTQGYSTEGLLTEMSLVGVPTCFPGVFGSPALCVKALAKTSERKAVELTSERLFLDASHGRVRSDYAAERTRFRRRSNFARPYPCLLISLRRVIWRRVGG